jgi:transposase-like protein
MCMLRTHSADHQRRRQQLDRVVAVTGAVTRVARQLGIGPESLRNWVKHAEIDNGKRPGVTADQRIARIIRALFAMKLKRTAERCDRHEKSLR